MNTRESALLVGDNRLKTIIEPEKKQKSELPPELQTGEINQEMVSSLRFGLKATLIAILGVVGFSIITFTGAPFALMVLINAWFSGSLVFLGGVSYGILNDLLAVRKNLPYFTLGHQPGQRGLIKSNDPNAVGIAWGILATFGLALPAALLFTVATLITGFIGLPFAGFVLPVIALIVPAVVGMAHVFSARRARKRAKEDPELLARVREVLDSEEEIISLDRYHTSRLKYWLKTPEDINAWLSNGDRNGFGYLVLPALAIVSLIGYVVLSALPAVLPALVFTAAFAAFPPLGAGLLLAIGVAAACVYLYRNHNKQVENAYKLDYPSDKKIELEEAADNDNSVSPAPVNEQATTYHHVLTSLGRATSQSDDEDEHVLDEDLDESMPMQKIKMPTALNGYNGFFDTTVAAVNAEAFESMNSQERHSLVA